MELYDLPHVCDEQTEEGSMKTEPAILSIPGLLDSQVMLPALVVVVDPRGDAKVGRHDSGARDVPCKNIAMLICPC